MNFRWNTVRSSFSSREETTYFLTCTDWLHCGNVNRHLLPRAHVVSLHRWWNGACAEITSIRNILHGQLGYERNEKEFCQGYQNIFPMVLWDRDNLLLIIINATLEAQLTLTVVRVRPHVVYWGSWTTADLTTAGLQQHRCYNLLPGRICQCDCLTAGQYNQMDFYHSMVLRSGKEDIFYGNHHSDYDIQLYDLPVYPSQSPALFNPAE